MPSPIALPIAVLVARMDLRPWAGVDLFHHGNPAAPITLPSSWTGKEGIFRDPIHATNGRGSEHALSDSLKAGWSGAGGNPAEVDITLTAADVLYVENTSAGDTLILDADADNAIWGLPTAGATIGPGQTLTGTDWRRGVITNGDGVAAPRLRFALDGGGTFRVPAVHAGWIQDVPTSLRSRGSVGDDDEGGLTPATDCLEELDNAATDPPSTTSRLRHGITDLGHHFVTGPVTMGALTWLDADAAFEFGWADTSIGEAAESVTVTGAGADDIGHTQSTWPVCGMVVPTVPPISLTPGIGVQTTGVTARDGRRVVTRWSTRKTWSFRFHITGPADQVDQHMHWIARTAERLLDGPAQLFHEWGDSRRTRERGAYTTLYTPQMGGYRGRRSVYVTSAEYDINWSASGGLMQLAQLDVELEEVPSGVLV